MTPRVTESSFDAQYRTNPDPWEYESSDYERVKYERTLAALPPGKFGRALEMGCSIGVFTELLADRCTDLIAVDFSERALAFARTRLADRRGVRIERRDLPEETPAGPFDLVVCSDVLYYWSEDLICDALSRVEFALAPGGSFLVVDWRGDDPEAPSDGDAVHALLRAQTVLARAHLEEHSGYLIERWDKPGSDS